GLSGAFEDPCWEGLGAEPCIFIKQDILHGIHKFFWDHPTDWLKNLLGVEEIDHHFIAQPPISTNRFAGGISIISQVTRREHRAFQQAILSIIIGHDHVDNKVINAISSLLDFSYLAQYPSLSASKIHKMEEALTTFHGNKQVFVDNGLQDPPHFRIPKLHGLQHFISDITMGGTPNNSSTETLESLHIEMCKEPYLASNHCGYDKQILNYLDVQDRLAMRYAY
ncbi:uncharacterized protein EI90DRAFT_2848256, partial [Cantharellus anzutake]|uniref:uncharacterized protein n=1 Tax=Cantharellus anzutake TaxID=1750568 RepID=UPI00190721D9